MAKIKELDNTIKAKVLSCKCPIKASLQDEEVEINASILSDVVPATTEKKGIIRIATDDEAIEGLSENTAITPHTLNIVTHYVHEQGISNNVWNIEHNLGKKPSITVVDSADTVIPIFKADYINENNIIITFNAAFTGKAFLN